MLLLLECFTAVMGIVTLVKEVFRNRFHNYATSIFLVCFVPLFCIYPVVERIAVGGAYTVRPGDFLVVSDTSVYLIYQLFCLSLLAIINVTLPKHVVGPAPDWQNKLRSGLVEQAVLVGMTTLSVYLYIRSTGLSASALLAASRFEWFNNADYSSTTFVVSSYLLAVSPVALLLALLNKRIRWVALIIVADLIFFGLLSKDRKWLIYIASAVFAYIYFRNGFQILVRRRIVVLGLSLATILALWQIARGVIFSYLVNGTGDVFYQSQQLAIDLLTKGDAPYYYNSSITAINMNLNYDYSIPFALLRRQLFFFLPADYSFGLKIEDISALFSDELNAGDSLRRGNMPPGLFGLFVISFGWIGGVVTCWLLPLMLRALDRYIQRSRGIGSIVVAAHLLSATLLLLRGDDSSATYFIVFSLVVFVLVRPLNFFGKPAAAAMIQST